MDTITATETTDPITIPQLAEGEVYAGLSRDSETGAWHHLVMLPGMGEDLTWKAAIKWAKSVGGELPTRDESALLYANVRDQIDTDDWYWTATPGAGDERGAWLQDFLNGNQTSYHEDTSYRARAVRRAPV